MKRVGFRRLFLGLAVGGSALALAAFSARAEEAAATCAPNGDVAYLCGVNNVEDLEQLPGRPLLIGASYGQRGTTPSLIVIDTEARAVRPLSVSVRARPERTYAACPSVLDMAQFSPHGIAIRAGARGRHQLLVVNHGGRESIEVFALDARGAEPRAQWIGCVVLPEGASGNAVAPLSDGGFVVTKFYDSRQGPWRAQFLARQATSAIYRWSPRTGFSTVPGGEIVSANGVEVSSDEQWLYTTSWVDKKIVRLPLNGAGAPSSIPIDFMPDNLRRAPDGSLLAAGQASTMELIVACHRPRCSLDWGVARLNPETMQLAYLAWEKGVDVFGGATTAVQVGDKLWVGTFRGDRMAIAPTPSAPLP